jgi:hypothetical protein
LHIELSAAKPTSIVRKKDVAIAKNYLTEPELAALSSKTAVSKDLHAGPPLGNTANRG